MSVEDVDDEFAALEAAEPARRYELDENEQEPKDIEPYDGGDDRDVSAPDLIKPQVHELNGHLLFAPFNPDTDGLRPYFGIVSAFEPDLEAEFDAVGSTWAIDHGPDDDDEYDKSTIRYWDGAIATREQDSGENYLEYQIPIYDTSDPKRNRRINFQFRPALPNAEHADSGNRIRSLPENLPEGVRVQVQASNVAPEHVLELLQALANAIGVNSHYFDRDDIHTWSRTLGLAFYVRCQREIVDEQVIGPGGLFERLSQFERQRVGRGELKWDNQEAFGRRHHIALDAEDHTLDVDGSARAGIESRWRPVQAIVSKSLDVTVPESDLARVIPADVDAGQRDIVAPVVEIESFDHSSPIRIENIDSENSDLRITPARNSNVSDCGVTSGVYPDHAPGTRHIEVEVDPIDQQTLHIM